MAELIQDRCRVQITQGNIDNRHIYVTELLDRPGFLPSDVFGEAQAARGLGKKVRLDVDGLDQPVMTDIPKEAGTNRPRKFFRERNWVTAFVQRHGLRAGDYIVFEKLGSDHFRVRPERHESSVIRPEAHSTTIDAAPSVSPESHGACRFELEQHLQEFLRRNWSNLSLGSEWELRGVEYGAGEIGRIDLLAHHKLQPRWLVIELKRDQTSDETVGQVLRYMGWVKERLAQAGDTVEGMVIAHSGDARIRYAMNHVPHVSLYTYEVSFMLRPA